MDSLSTWLFPILFYSFAVLAVLSAAMVIIAKNAVRSVLFLILTFFLTGCLWMMLESEFLAISLVLVYVGAVMVLFLFVVMMLDVELAAIREGFTHYLPWGVLVMLLVMIGLVYAVQPSVFGIEHYSIPNPKSLGYSQVTELGKILYTRYLYPFEVAGVLLLVAIVSAISLTFRGRQGSRAPLVEKQLKANKENRLKIIKMETEK